MTVEVNPTAKHLLSVRAAGDLRSEAREAGGETETVVVPHTGEHLR